MIDQSVQLAKVNSIPRKIDYIFAPAAQTHFNSPLLLLINALITRFSEKKKAQVIAPIKVLSYTGPVRIDYEFLQGDCFT